MTKPNRPAKGTNTAKKKSLAKKRALKLPSEAAKKTTTVTEQGKNVPPILTYKELLSKLPAKHARFVEEYLIDLNETKAAIRAGYSEKSASKQGYRLSRNVQVQAVIDAGKVEISKRNMINQDEVIKELALIGFSDIKNYMNIDPLTGVIQCKGFEDMPEQASKAIESISEDRVIRETADGKQIIINDKRKFKLHNKVTALLGILDRVKPSEPQKHEVTVKGMTLFPPEPKTMAEYEALIKGGKV